MVLFIVLCIFSALLPQCTTKEDPAVGKDQLIDALDAAFARVMDSGRFREIINSDPVAGPLMVNIGDCYPRIVESGVEIYPFPRIPQVCLKIY